MTFSRRLHWFSRETSSDWFNISVLFHMALSIAFFLAGLASASRPLEWWANWGRRVPRTPTIVLGAIALFAVMFWVFVMRLQESLSS